MRQKKRGRRSTIGTLAAGSSERAEVAAAKAMAEAGATARREAEAAAREEIRGAYAAAVEPMVRAEVLAAEKVAVPEADADDGMTKTQLSVVTVNRTVRIGTRPLIGRAPYLGVIWI